MNIAVDEIAVPTVIAYSHTTLGTDLPDSGFLLIIPHTTSYDNVEQLNSDIRYLSSSYKHMLHGQVSHGNDDYDIYAYAQIEERCRTIFNNAVAKCESGAIF